METKTNVRIQEHVVKELVHPHKNKEAEIKWTELNNLRRPGDFVIVGQMVGITAQNALRAFSRIGSKYHSAVVEALDKVINSRQQLIYGTSQQTDDK